MAAGYITANTPGRSSQVIRPSWEVCKKVVDLDLVSGALQLKVVGVREDEGIERGSSNERLLNWWHLLGTCASTPSLGLAYQPLETYSLGLNVFQGPMKEKKLAMYLTQIGHHTAQGYKQSFLARIRSGTWAGTCLHTYALL